MEISKKMNILLKNNTTSEIKVSLQTQALKDIEKKEQRNLFEHDLHAAIIADRSIDVDNKFDIKIEEIRLKPSESYKLEYDKLIEKGGIFEKKTDGRRRRKLLVSIKDREGSMTQSRYLLIGSAHEKNLRLFPIENDTYEATIAHNYLNDAETMNTPIIESGKVAQITFENNNTSGNWMEKLAIDYPEFKDMKLSDMVIPGSHDASTNNIGDIYNEKNNVAYCNEELPYAGDLIQDLKIMDKSTIKKVARAQKLSIKEQLKCGARYFDFRVTYSQGKYKKELPLSFDWFTIHTFLSNSAIKDLEEIKDFANSNKNEIIIINLNRLIIDIPAANSKVIANKQREFLLFLRNEFNEIAYNLSDLNIDNGLEDTQNRKTIHDITYNDVIKKGKNVIFISSFCSVNKMDKNLIAHELKEEFENLIFDMKVEHTKKKSWANTNNIKFLIKHESDFIKKENNINHKLYKISLHATVVKEDYINLFIKDTHKANGAITLESYAIISNSIMFNFIKKQIEKGNRINIITADYVGTSFNPAQWAMELNILKLQQTDYCNPNNLFEELSSVYEATINSDSSFRVNRIDYAIKEFLMANKFVNDIEKAFVIGYGILKITNEFSPEDIFNKYKSILEINEEDNQLYKLCAYYIYNVYNKPVGIDILNKIELQLKNLDIDLNLLSNRLLKFNQENNSVHYIFKRWKNTFNIANKLKNMIDINANNPEFKLISKEIDIILKEMKKNKLSEDLVVHDKNEKSFLKLSLVGSAIIYRFKQKNKQNPSIDEFKQIFYKAAESFKKINLKNLENEVELFFKVFELNVDAIDKYEFPEIAAIDYHKILNEVDYNQKTIIQRKIFINMLRKFKLIDKQLNTD